MYLLYSITNINALRLMEYDIEIKFHVIIECEVCSPVEGMLINCVARNITKAGIRADSSDESPSPIICFAARPPSQPRKDWKVSHSCIKGLLDLS